MRCACGRTRFDDELVSAMTEAIHSALAQERGIKDRNPFVNTSVGGEQAPIPTALS